MASSSARENTSVRAMAFCGSGTLRVAMVMADTSVSASMASMVGEESKRAMSCAMSAFHWQETTMALNRLRMKLKCAS